MYFTSITQIENFFANISHKKRDYPPFFMLNQALELLDNPQNDFQYIQITGTNGKGSTANYLSHFLTAHQLNVALFTSPHIFEITERIKINNITIPVADFIMIFNTLYQQVGATCKLIQFEWLYLIALTFFKTQKIDVVILEVGIGGLYDTTNTIPQKLAAVITNIDYDHQNILGNSLAEIATQKLGIITNKTKYTFIGNIKQATLYPLIKKHCTAVATTPYFYQQDFYYDTTKNIFHIFDYEIALPTQELPLYQYENIALSMAVADKILAYFQKKTNIQFLLNIMTDLQLPIRFEILQKNERTYIFDGAHNISGITVALESLTNTFPNQKYTFIYSAMADKEYKQMLALLSKYGTVVLFDYYQIYQRAFKIENDNNHLILKNTDDLVAYNQTASDAIIVYIGSIYYVSHIRNLFRKGII